MRIWSSRPASTRPSPRPPGTSSSPTPRRCRTAASRPYGLTFDSRDWRSLIPVTHSISTDVYTPDGLFMYDSDAAVQALEILKRMMELTSSDILVGRTASMPRSRWTKRHSRRSRPPTTSSTRMLPCATRPSGRTRPSSRSRSCRPPKAASAAPSSGTRAPSSSRTARTRRRRSSSSPPSPRTSGSGEQRRRQRR